MSNWDVFRIYAASHNVRSLSSRSLVAQLYLMWCSRDLWYVVADSGAGLWYVVADEANVQGVVATDEMVAKQIMWDLNREFSRRTHSVLDEVLID